MTTKQPLLPNGESSAHELPEKIRTLEGVDFCPRDERWSYRESTFNVSIDFTKLHAVPQLIYSAKSVFLWYAQNKSAKHLVNMHARLAHFFNTLEEQRHPPVALINSTMLLNYKASLSSRTAWYMGALSGFFQKWHDLSIPGVTDDAVALLKQFRFKGNNKGEAILTMDPEKGPFTDIEFEAIQVALNNAFEAGHISLSDFILVILFMVLGQRPVQYAALKICDICVGKAKDGAPIYTLRMPRAKQRGQMTRAEFKDRVLLPKIGIKLVQYADEIRDAFKGILKDPDQAPLFPAKRSRKNEPVGFEHHRTAESLTNTLECILRRLNVISERTGKPLHITATRFRRTVGTRAASEGHGELVIAELLDHSDTQNVGIYVEAVPDIVERIDRAMAMHLAPLAQAFSGIIISDESQATRADDPASRICDPRFDSSMKPMGNCGQYGYCGLLAPIACYTCRSFQPWLDGPHEAVLEHLLTERERLMSGGDTRIATINDRTLLAVAEVVRQCEAIRKEEGMASHA